MIKSIVMETFAKLGRLIQQIELTSTVNEKGEDVDTLIAAGVAGVFFYEFKYQGATDIK